jgi:hypothetical protein
MVKTRRNEAGGAGGRPSHGTNTRLSKGGAKVGEHGGGVPVSPTEANIIIHGLAAGELKKRQTAV